MKLTQNLRKLGDAVCGLALSDDLLALLGIDAGDGPEDVTVTLTFYGDTLIVRRADAPLPSPAEVAYFLTDDLGVTKHLPAQLAAVDETPNDIEALLKPGTTLRLTPMMRYSLGLFKQFGELSRDDLIHRFSVAPAQATRILSTGFEDRALVKRGSRYRLNPELFEV